MSDPRDEFTLLCEGCGYVVEGLPVEGNCPECGRPIPDSLPTGRQGTPWQRHPDPGMAAWWRTTGVMLRHPWDAWDHVRIEPGTGGFGRACRWIAGALIAVVAAARFLREARISTMRDAIDSYGLGLSFIGIASWGGGLILLWIVAALGLSALTRVEMLGLRFVGRQRGWRVTPAVAHTVCGHACVGWLLAAVLWAACALAVDTGVARRAVAALGLPRPPPSVWLRTAAPFGGFFVGLLVFEFLVYFGVRRNRFANRARPEPVQLRHQT